MINKPSYDHTHTNASELMNVCKKREIENISFIRVSIVNHYINTELIIVDIIFFMLLQNQPAQPNGSNR